MKLPSEIFNSIDEVKAFVDRISNQASLSDDDRQELLFLCGLEENKALTGPVIIDGVEILIDQYIVPIIMDLNERGIHTIASCSGLQSEHKESIHQPDRGYLAVDFCSDLLQHLKDNLDDAMFSLKAAEAYLKPAVIIYILGNSDEELKTGWHVLWNILKAYH